MKKLSLKKKIGLFVTISLLLIIGLSLYSLNNSEYIDPTNSEASTSNTPNVLMILMDDLDSPVFNQMLENGLLPNIKKYLSDVGINLENAFVSDSHCCPSRTSILTGRYAHNTGVWNVVGSEGGINAFIKNGNNDNNLAVWLKDEGYYNGYVGKYLTGTQPIHQINGWDDFTVIDGFDPRPRQYVAWSNKNSQKTNPDYYQNKYIYDVASGFLDDFDQNNHNNFFLTVAPRAVHADLKRWTEVNIDGNFPGNGELISLNTYVDSNGYRKQLIIRKELNGNYNAYRRTTLDGFEWKTMGMGFFENTGAGEIISHNAFIDHEGKERHTLIRKNNNTYDMYIRTKTGDTWSTWDENIYTNWKTDNGNGDILDWNVSLLPNNDRKQEILRRNNFGGYDLYSKIISSANRGTEWEKAPASWDFNTANPDFSPITSYNSYTLESGVQRQQIVRKTSEGYRLLNLDTASFFDENPALSNNIVNKTAAQEKLDNELIKTLDNTLLSEDTSDALEYIVPEKINPVFPTNGRIYADGNWENHNPNQTFDLSLYRGNFPAGSLRADGLNGFIPLKSEYDLPGIIGNNPAFNNLDCTKRHQWYCDNWPDLNTMTTDGITHLDYLRRYHLDRMETMISIDVMVGELIKDLENKDLLDNTLIIFTSDNGYSLGENRIVGKVTADEEATRVPLIIREPKSLTKTTEDKYALNVDLAPTILDYIGVNWKDAKYKIDGSSLKPSETWSREYILFERRYPRDWVLTKPVHTLPDYGAIRTKNNNGEEILYISYGEYPIDLNKKSDFELMNFDKNSSIIGINELKTFQNNAQELQEKLNELKSCKTDGCR